MFNGSDNSHREALCKAAPKSVDRQRWNIWVQPQGTIRDMSIAEVLIDTADYKSQAKIQWSKERIAASLGVAESIQEKSKTKEFITGIESELAATQGSVLGKAPGLPGALWVTSAAEVVFQWVGILLGSALIRSLT